MKKQKMFSLGGLSLSESTLIENAEFVPETVKTRVPAYVLLPDFAQTHYFSKIGEIWESAMFRLVKKSFFSKEVIVQKATIMDKDAKVKWVESSIYEMLDSLKRVYEQDRLLKREYDEILKFLNQPSMIKKIQKSRGE